MIRPSNLRPALLGSALALSLGIAGCGDATGEDSSNVTDIQHSSVKNQSIGNCWVYASLGWAESLHLRYTGEELNLSESYISYWHWFEQIRGGAPGQRAVMTMSKSDELSTGGWWGVAGELMLRYGLIAEGDFIPQEEEAARSARQSAAQSTINASLKSGVLSDPEKRRDAAVVRAELDKAWQLSDEVIAMLDATFGPGVDRVLYNQGPAAGSKIFEAGAVTVGHLDEDGQRTIVTLADAIGQPKSSYSFLERKGTFAWQTRSYPSGASSRRGFQIDVQRAMNASQPVILSWLVDFNAMSGNHFKAPPATPGRQGGHLVIVEDYQVTDVPGYGTLAAGTTILDPEVLNAALAPEAKLELIRIKNSWGSSLAPDNLKELGGYHDLYLEYLDGPIKECHEENGNACARTTDATPWRQAILPPAKFLDAAAATCDPDAYQDNCSGNVLQWCEGGRLERFNCADGQWSCGMNENLGQLDCIDPPTG